MNFLIGIPTLNRYDLLKPNLSLYAKDFEGIEIVVIDNGKQGITEKVNLIENERNLGVGKSWNIISDYAFNSRQLDFALILNDDIYLGKNKQNVLDLYNKKKTFIRSTQDWSAFILPRTVFENVGKFDECFYPAYYEDSSYEYRMKLMSVNAIKTPELNPIIYNQSQTLEKAPEILDFSKKNKKLYVEMWGGLPEREKYKKAFNK
jgi:GT2 family glycosyltransferase